MKMDKEEKIPKVVQAVCTTTCADCRQRFEAGQVYSIRVDNPVLKFFEPVVETSDPGDLGPAGVVLTGAKK